MPGKPTFSNLIKRILKLVPDLEQLRLSSIDCAEIDEEFWDLLYEKKLMPHFHISLQAGNNLILKRMKRRHTREMAIDFCKKILSKRKEATFGADLIAGFPTETDEMFKDTLDLVDKCNLTHLHVFPYSPRDNTPAARMPQVDKSIVKKRANILRSKGIEKFKKLMQDRVGEKDLVLIEKNQNEQSIGKDQNFFNVILNEKLKEGNLVPCVYIGVKNNMLLARRL